MPYNKGDFTQQGVNGDVSALVRLNEKRVMKVVLSSDDESDNCDISGKVYDLLNGTSYDIGSGGGGGGGFPKCTATVVNNNNDNDTFWSLYNGVVQQITIPANSNITIELPYFFDDEYEEYLVYSYLLGSRANNDSSYISNMENMTTSTWEPDTVALKITDPTADSSVTLDIAFLQRK